MKRKEKILQSFSTKNNFLLAIIVLNRSDFPVNLHFDGSLLAF